MRLKNRKRKNNDTEKRQRDKENTKMENRKDVMYTDMAKKAAEKTKETKETEKAREQEEKDMSQNKTQNPDNGEMTRRELKSRRTGSTKTFENSDHSFTTEIYLSPVHYQTEDGSWEEMDDTLEAVETQVEAETTADMQEKAENAADMQEETADAHGSFRAQAVALSGAVDETADVESQPEKNTPDKKENAALSAMSLFRSYCGSYPTLHIRCLRLKAHLKCFRLCNRRHRSSKDRGCTDCAPLSFPCRLCAVPNRDARDKDHCQERPFQAQTRDRI